MLRYIREGNSGPTGSKAWVAAMNQMVEKVKKDQATSEQPREQPAAAARPAPAAKAYKHIQ
eukprot:15644356-Heterocapsa_arctica.AAC.1